MVVITPSPHNTELQIITIKRMSVCACVIAAHERVTIKSIHMRSADVKCRYRCASITNSFYSSTSPAINEIIFWEEYVIEIKDSKPTTAFNRFVYLFIHPFQSGSCCSHFTSRFCDFAVKSLCVRCVSTCELFLSLVVVVVCAIT